MIATVILARAHLSSSIFKSFMATTGSAGIVPECTGKLLSVSDDESHSCNDASAVSPLRKKRPRWASAPAESNVSKPNRGSSSGCILGEEALLSMDSIDMKNTSCLPELFDKDGGMLAGESLADRTTTSESAPISQLLQEAVRDARFDMRGPLGARWFRALRRDQKLADEYNLVSGRELRRAFKVEWAKTQLQCVEERKEECNTSSIIEKNYGVYLPFVVIVQKEGGMDCPSSVEAAVRYCRKCCVLGGHWRKFNSFTSRWEYLYIRCEFSSLFEKQWSMHVTQSSGRVRRPGSNSVSRALQSSPSGSASARSCTRIERSRVSGKGVKRHSPKGPASIETGNAGITSQRHVLMQSHTDGNDVINLEASPKGPSREGNVSAVVKDAVLEDAVSEDATSENAVFAVAKPILDANQMELLDLRDLFLSRMTDEVDELSRSVFELNMRYDAVVDLADRVITSLSSITESDLFESAVEDVKLKMSELENVATACTFFQQYRVHVGDFMSIERDQIALVQNAKECLRVVGASIEALSKSVADSKLKDFSTPSM